MSPLGDDEYVADLAYDLGFPLLVVAPIRVGAINLALQTLITAATFRDGLPVAGIVLNAIEQRDDSARQTSLEIRRRAVAPVLAEVRRLLHEDCYTIKGVQKLHRDLGAKHFLAGERPPAELDGDGTATADLTADARRRLTDALEALESAKARLDGLLGET